MIPLDTRIIIGTRKYKIVYIRITGSKYVRQYNRILIDYNIIIIIYFIKSKRFRI